MKKQLLMMGAVLLLAAGTACAQENAGANPNFSDQHLCYDQNDRYQANEFVVDGFGSAALEEQTIEHLSGDRVRHNTRLGAGLSAGYFFTRNLGLDAEAYSEDTGHSFVNNVLGNFIARFPIGQSGLALYVFGGGGRKFVPEDLWFVHAGAGLEYRFTRNIGIFTDARYAFPLHTKNYGLLRAGLRFAF